MVASILKSKKEIPNEYGYMDIDSTLQINPCVGLCFLKPLKSLHAVQLCSLKKTSLNSQFINFDEKPVSFKRCRLLWAFENWELAP